MDELEMTQCPACGEDVPVDASRCSHCGERLGEKRSRSSGNSQLAAQARSEATTSMILGLVGFLACQLAGPFAIMKANEAKRLAQRARIPLPGEATAGLVLGWISTGILILTVLMVGFFFVLAMAGAVASGR